MGNREGAVQGNGKKSIAAIHGVSIMLAQT